MIAPQTQEAYRRLRQMILSLELPPGEALVERRLEEYFRDREGLIVSRTPIRSALGLLAQEGLVRREGRTYRVAPLDWDELEEAFAFRKVLETTAVRMAAARKPRAEGVAQVLAALGEDLDPESELAKATDFHLELARLCGNRFLLEALGTVLSRIYRVRFLEVMTPEGRLQARRDHQRLLELVQQGQGEEAARLIEEHLERSRQRMLEGRRSPRGELLARP
ncbi:MULTISPECIES: GntR family transcriptional regulator [unclassified Meiothermus]|uniref:GntR family transcriptional regulator n=1 Tax=unclassified Meiothermus TaxID=370471 RepID=UPI000D7CD95F|nr:MULTISPECIES: GntR family transcriptional regulator [unclassified Meiothermus]PZA08446.1 GntR family transcriptional regulator [Meiothermus sp. Pnk-1]RYM31388.1 GntR family transcriptional regulator [Meiothermus sp. PNK-Is4]